MKVLFVCTAAQNRSPAGVEVVKEDFPWHETKFAGIHELADIVVTAEAIEWADIIFAMENMNLNKIVEMFPNETKGKKIISLGIPEIFRRDDPNLKDLIRTGIKHYLTYDPPRGRKI